MRLGDYALHPIFADEKRKTELSEKRFFVKQATGGLEQELKSVFILVVSRNILLLHLNVSPKNIFLATK